MMVIGVGKAHFVVSFDEDPGNDSFFFEVLCILGVLPMYRTPTTYYLVHRVGVCPYRDLRRTIRPIQKTLGCEDRHGSIRESENPRHE